MSKSFLKVTSDFTEDFDKLVKSFRRDKVLVGIPEEKSTRQDGEKIGNAGLLAIANFGSPKKGIPPWPIMQTGIRNAQAGIAEAFKGAGKAALSGGLSALSVYYNRAGSIAANAIKKVINQQEGVPSNRPAPATLRARKLQGFKGTKYWLRTGQLRNAITWVLKRG